MAMRFAHRHQRSRNLDMNKRLKNMAFDAHLKERIVSRVPVFRDLFEMDWRQRIYQLLSLLMLFSSAFLFWKAFATWTGVAMPSTAVLSGSMKPAFYRGDVLFITNDPKRELQVGDIVVFKLSNKNFPIVHRIIKVFKIGESVKFLTKGDNNRVDDTSLYPESKRWLTREDVIGVAKGYIPYAGYVTIILHENHKLRLIVIGIFALSVLLYRE